MYGTRTYQENIIKVEELPSPWDYTGELTWLVDGLIPANAVTMLSGASGCGKSTLTLALAHSVARGEPFIGRKTTQKPVLILDKENSELVYRVRLAQLGLERVDNLYVWGPKNTPPSSPLDNAIKEFVQTAQPLLIFDSLIAFHSGNEQDATETREYMEKFIELSKNGATVILIHHTGKGENTKEYRGSSDIKAAVDYGYVMESRNDMESIVIKDIKHRLSTGRDLIPVHYKDGKYLPGRDVQYEQVISYVENNPDTIETAIVDALKSEKLPGNRIRTLLHKGVSVGQLVVRKGLKNASHYSLAGA